MRKCFLLILAVMLVFASVTGASASSIDLSGLTLDELIDLRQRITMAMWETDAYQEVVVPPGLWVVGEDIPAGTWTIKCADTRSEDPDLYVCYFKYGQKLNERGNEIKRASDHYDSITLYNPNGKYSVDQLTEYPVTLYDGDYVQIEKGWGSALFTTYLGKPALGFQ